MVMPLYYTYSINGHITDHTNNKLITTDVCHEDKLEVMQYSKKEKKEKKLPI